MQVFQAYVLRIANLKVAINYSHMFRLLRCATPSVLAQECKLNILLQFRITHNDSLKGGT